MASIPASSTATAALPTVTKVAIGIGDWLDVMDSEGVWNAARVINFPSNTEAEVTYDGWDSKFNEVVALNSDGVAPFQSYTWAVKCWAKYKNWPWWPSVVTVRSPGTDAGRNHLAQEKRMFVDFLDDQDISKRCRCWVDLERIKPFDDLYERQLKKPGDARYKASLARALESRALEGFPAMVRGGTLPEAFKTQVATPVPSLKEAVGRDEWIASLNSNKIRHAQVYVYPLSPADLPAAQERRPVHSEPSRSIPQQQPDTIPNSTSSQGTETSVSGGEKPRQEIVL